MNERPLRVGLRHSNDQAKWKLGRPEMTDSAAPGGWSPAGRVASAQICATCEERQKHVPTVPRPAQFRAVSVISRSPHRAIVALERAQAGSHYPANWVPTSLIPDTPCRLAQRSAVDNCAHGLFLSQPLRS
jgi:hypothetical protein